MDTPEKKTTPLCLRMVRVGSVNIAIPEAEVLTCRLARTEPEPLPHRRAGVIAVQGKCLPY